MDKREKCPHRQPLHTGGHTHNVTSLQLQGCKFLTFVSNLKIKEKKQWVSSASPRHYWWCLWSFRKKRDRTLKKRSIIYHVWYWTDHYVLLCLIHPLCSKHFYEYYHTSTWDVESNTSFVIYVLYGAKQLVRKINTSVIPLAFMKQFTFSIFIRSGKVTKFRDVCRHSFLPPLQ